MRSESRGRAVVIVPAALLLGSKDHIQLGLPKPHCGESARLYSRRGGSLCMRNVEKAPWRVLEMTSPKIPERGFQKRSLESSWGFAKMSSVFIPGTWYPHVNEF